MWTNKRDKKSKTPCTRGKDAKPSPLNRTILLILAKVIIEFSKFHSVQINSLWFWVEYLQLGILYSATSTRLRPPAFAR